MGTLIEERYFGYKANSDDRPDFPEAGVELKATCFDVLKDGRKSAGERLVLTMIPYDRPVSLDYDNSHLKTKLSNILLITTAVIALSINTTSVLSALLWFACPKRT